MANCGLPLLALACLCLSVCQSSAQEDQDVASMFRQITKSLNELKTSFDLTATVSAMKEKMDQMEQELKALKNIPKVAFAASLGGNGLQKTSYEKILAYKDVLTNVGGAYNPETGEFTAPVRGVYYIRFTANAPTDNTMSSMLYKNDGYNVVLAVHEQPSGEGSDTASNGAALLLEKGDRLRMKLWSNTQIWDNANHHSTFSGFLLFPM